MIQLTLQTKIILFDIISSLLINLIYFAVTYIDWKIEGCYREACLWYLFLYLICIFQLIISIISQIVFDIKYKNHNKKWFKRKALIFFFTNIWFVIGSLVFIFIFLPFLLIATWIYKYRLLIVNKKRIPGCGKYLKHILWRLGRNYNSKATLIND